MNFTREGNREVAVLLADDHTDILQQVLIVMHGEFDCRLVSNSFNRFAEFDEGRLTAKDFQSQNEDSGHKNQKQDNPAAP